MKLKQLLEMPELNSDEMEVLDKPTFITDADLAKDYDIIAQRDKVVIAIKKGNGKGGLKVIAGELVTLRYGLTGITQYGTMTFDTIDMLKAVESNLPPFTPKLIQVATAVVHKTDHLKGIGSLLYTSLVQAGFTIVSDIYQFIGAKHLWKKLGRTHSVDEVIHIYNCGKVVVDANGKPIDYDGSNVPDANIWSSDDEHENMLLAYRLR